MSAATALRPMWIAGLTDCKGIRKVTTDSFLRTKIAHVNSAPINGKFTLYVSNKNKLTEFFCHEADRFSSAAFESLAAETVRPTFPRSTGWQLIRGYYAGFFALHSLMRLHGWACTRLTTEACARLEKESKLFFPGSDKITAGMYMVKAGSANTELAFTSLGANSGGSHEALWGGLFDFLSEITNVTLNQPVDQQASQQLVDSVTAFRALLQKHGGPLWLTRIRNKVNYAHEFGAWIPYHMSTCDSTRVSEVLERWRTEPSSVIAKATSDEILQFCEACAFLVSLCRTTIKDLAFRAATNSPIKLTIGRLLT
jgi:hypothetical protein